MNEELWFNVICLERNEQYIELLLKKFGIEKYNLTYHNNILSLLFEYKMDSYRCDIDKINMEVVLLKRNLCGKSRKDKYHVVKKFDGVDCFYKILKFVTKRK